MKSCPNCGAGPGDQAVFRQIWRVSDSSGADPKGSKVANQQLLMPKTVFYVTIIALALMGLAVVGLAVRGPNTITQTQTNYVTEMQLTTISISTTTTEAYTLASSTTLPAGPPPIWFSQQYCGYPFNPYVCSEGPPVTITGYLTNSSGCVNLYVSTNQDYVVWNLPRTYSDGAYQVYGFIYPNWPPTQPFPPYPFQKILCVGIPMWSIPPYIQAA